MRSPLLLLAALVAALLAFALWRSLGPGAPGEPAAMPSPGVRATDGDERAALRPPVASGEVERLEASAVEPQPPAGAGGGVRLAAPRERARLEIEVVDTADQPVAGALLRLRSHTGPRPELYALADDRSVERQRTADELGRAVLDDLPDGPYEVLAAATAEDAPTLERFLLEAPETSVRVRLDEPHRSVAQVPVRVVDGEGAPVPGAAVELTAGAGDLRGGRAGGTTTRAAVTDEQGLARFPDPGYLGLVVVATAPDGRRGSATVWTRANVLREARAGGVEVRVDAPARLEGTLTGLPPERLGSARVLARLLTNTFPHHTTHGRDFEAPVVAGRYVFEDLAPGTYTLSLDDPGGARLVLPPFEGWGRELPNSLDPIEVELTAGARVARDLPVTPGGILEGRVRDESGAPLAGAVVRATITPRTSNFPDGFYLHGVNVWRFDAHAGGDDDHPETHRRTTSGADGRYRLAGLHPGLHRVEVALSGRVYDRREEVELHDGGTTPLEHTLAPAGAIQGVSRDGGYVGVLPEGSSQPRMIAIVSREAVFCFPGLEPGRWTVARFHSDSRIAPAPLATVEVEAGRTTWVDLDREGDYPVRLVARVLERGRPLEGAWVRSGRQRTRSDALGRVELRAPFARTGQVGFTVEHGGVETTFSLPGMAPEDRVWEGDLELGEHALGVVAQDADGLPSEVSLDLRAGDLARPEIDSVLGRELALDAPGLRALPAGRYDVLATFPDGSRVGAQVELPQAAPLALRAPPAGTLEVLVRHPDGRAAAEVRVVSFTWTGEGPPPEERDSWHEASEQRTGLTDADGRLVLEGVPAGAVLVHASEPLSGWLAEPRPEAQERLQLARGDRLSLELRLEQP